MPFGLVAGRQYFVEVNGVAYSAQAELNVEAVSLAGGPAIKDDEDDGQPEEPPVSPDDPPAGFGTFVVLRVGAVTVTSADSGQTGTIEGPAGTTVKFYDADPRKATTAYVRGLGLIASRTNGVATYYHYDAHGNVVQLTDAAGTVTKNYTYDAFGVEKGADDTDVNPFRYCGEQYDTETGNYYLRARYYTPGTGRFTQEDTHWNTKNMVYGDDPQKWNEYQSWLNEDDRDDPLGLHTYTYKPEATALAQAGNLYGYGLNNPVYFADFSGRSAAAAVITSQLDSPLPGPADIAAGVILGGSAIVAGGVWLYDTFWAKPSSSSSKGSSGSGEAASGGPKRDDDQDKQLKIINDKDVNEVARKLGFDGAEDFKESIAGRSGGKFNMKYNPKTREIFLDPITKGNPLIPTGYFMP